MCNRLVRCCIAIGAEKANFLASATGIRYGVRINTIGVGEKKRKFLGEVKK